MMTVIKNKLLGKIESDKVMLNEDGRPVSRFRNRMQRAAVRGLIVFFSVMLGFTLVSRASDGITIARVRADTIRTGIITNRITLNGSILPLEHRRIYLPGNLYITDPRVNEGQFVREGEELLRFDAADVLDQLRRLKDNLAIVLLRIENVEIDLAGSSDIFAVSNARKELNLAQEDLRRLQERYAAGRARLLEDWQRAEDDLLMALGEIPSGRDNGVTEAYEALQRAIQDFLNLEARLGMNWDDLEANIHMAMAELESVYGPDYVVNSITTARLALENAIRDRDGTAYAQAVIVQRARDDERAARAALDDAWAGLETAVADAREDWIEAAEESVFNAERELCDLNYQNARQVLIDLAQERYNDARRYLWQMRARTDFSDHPYVISAQNDITAAEDRLQSAQRALEDAVITERTQLNLADRSVEEARRGLQTAFENAQIAADDALSAFEYNVLSVEDQLRAASRNIESAQRDLERAVEDASDKAVAASESFYDHAADYGDQIFAAERDLERARRNYEQALWQAGESALGDARSLNQSAIDMISYLAEKEDLRRSIEIFSQLAEKEGRLLSPVDGNIHTIAPVGITQEHTAVAIISDNNRGFNFEAAVEEQAARDLVLGSRGILSFTREGRAQRVDAVITGIGAVDEHGYVTVIGALPEGIYPVGASAELIITQTSERQNATLPLGALRTDSDGDYVLALVENRTVTGVELTTERIPVTVLMRDNERMSVSSSLARGQMVITSASRPVSEGDRVRLE